MTTTTTLQHDVISSDKVQGAKVYNAAGEKLGSIDDLMIDKRSGEVCYAVLEFGGFLGMGADRYPLPWGVMSYDTAKGGYVVPLDKTQLERAPKFREGDIPEFTPSYRREVQDYYGPERQRAL